MGIRGCGSGGGGGGGGDLGLDGFEGGDDEGGGGVDGDVAGDDADAPAAGAPFGVFVVGEGARWDGEEGAAGEIGLLGPALEDVGFAGAGGGVDDDVAAGFEGADGRSLPAVGEDEFLEAGKGVGQHRVRRCAAVAGGQIPDAVPAWRGSKSTSGRNLERPRGSQGCCPGEAQGFCNFSPGNEYSLWPNQPLARMFFRSSDTLPTPP